MRRTLIALSLVASMPALAEKPWETRVNLAVPVPVELPAVPPTNPFATPLATLPAPVATPLREKFQGTFTVLASVYVDTEGTSRHVVFTQLPLPGLSDALRPEVFDLTFKPGRSSGAAVSTWLPIGIDLHGRIDEGRVARLQPTAPDPATPPVPEPAPTPLVEAQDLELPATPIERLDQLPSPKHSKVRVNGRSWHQGIRVLAEISAGGHCQRVVFLSCPDGLRGWLLASMAAWTFRPATTNAGPLTAWVQLDGDVELELGYLSADALRIMSQGWSPRGGAQAAGGRPPGV
jgi:hypothetical protein